MKFKSILIFVIAGLGSIALFYGLLQLVQDGLQKLKIFDATLQYFIIVVLAIILLVIIGKSKLGKAVTNILDH